MRGSKPSAWRSASSASCPASASPARNASSTAPQKDWRRGWSKTTSTFTAVSARIPPSRRSFPGRPVLMGPEIPPVALEQTEVDVRIVDLVAGLAVADLQIDHVAVRAVDELMAISPAGGEARDHPRRQALRAGIGHQLDLAFENVDELVLGAVPVSLGGGAAGRQADEIDPEMAEAEGIAESPLLALLHRPRERGGIAAAEARLQGHRV